MIADCRYSRLQQFPVELLTKSRNLERQILTERRAQGTRPKTSLGNLGHTEVVSVETPCGAARMEFWRGTGLLLLRLNGLIFARP